MPNFATYDDFKQWYLSNDKGFANMAKGDPHAAEVVLQKLWNMYVARNEAMSSGDWNSFLGVVGQNSGNMNAETEKWLDNMIANQRTEEARDYDTEMRDTSLVSAADQLKSLGLSVSNVTTTGGAVNNGVSAANQSMHSIAALKQQQRINNFNQKMNIARSLISTAGSMASSGIYGAALGAVKHAGSQAASALSHSGLNALKSGPSIPDIQKAFGISDSGGSFAGDNSNFF